MPLVAIKVKGLSPLDLLFIFRTDGSKDPLIKVVRKIDLSEFIGSLFKKSFLSLTAPILELVRAIASFLSASINSVDPPPISMITKD